MRIFYGGCNAFVKVENNAKLVDKVHVAMSNLQYGSRSRKLFSKANLTSGQMRDICRAIFTHFFRKLDDQRIIKNRARSSSNRSCQLFGIHEVSLF